MSGTAKVTVKTYQNYINGQWVNSSSGETFPVYDPSTEEVIANVAVATVADVDKAVKAARAAFDSGPWAQTSAVDRGRILFKLADKVRQNSAMLAELESRNCGKPIVEAEYDIADVATCFEYYGGLANKVSGSVNPVPANALSFTMREPVGVAGQIIPWNFPLLMAAWKLAPAIAAGCCCVLKPAEQTPLTAMEFANWFEEVGLPPGVVNVVNGMGEVYWGSDSCPSRRRQDCLHRECIGREDYCKGRGRYLEEGNAGTWRQVAQRVFCRRGLGSGRGRRAIRRVHQSRGSLLRRQPYPG